MKITYQVIKDLEDMTLVRITPESPLNGFHGVDLPIANVPAATHDAFIHDRVVWKVRQEIGGQANVDIVKVD